MYAPSPSTLRTCVVSFLNARPLYHSLVDPQKAPRGADGEALFAVETRLPAECGEALAQGECDLALVPVGSFVEHPEWEIVPDLAIACRGAVETVIVVAEKPLSELKTILLDGASKSSVLLLELLLADMELHPDTQRVEHGQGSQKVEGDTGALVIGDAAWGLKERFSYCYDLGQVWFERTGLPFVFAFWAAKPGVLHPEHIEALAWAKNRSLQKFAESIANDYFEQEYKQREDRASSLDARDFSNYLRKTIQYNLETQHREGIAEFLGRLTALREGRKESSLDDLHIQFAGRAIPEPLAKARNRRAESMDCDKLLQKASEGERLDLAEGIYLYENAKLIALGHAADKRRKALHPDEVVTYIIDRNVNYTNYCVTRCKFCNFYVPPNSDRGYVLSREELALKFRATEEAGGIQILLQGGLNPDLDLAYYEDLFRWTKANFKLNLHALSPTEIIHIAQLEELSIREVLKRLQAAGMDTLPGGGAEILDDEVRNRISPFKNNTEEWLEVMRQAHALGMRSSASMVFGFQETSEQLLMHLHRLRELQDESGGFTAFIAWPFQAQGTRLKLRDDTSAQRYLRVQAVARLYLDNIPSIQVSWPTLGPEVGELALRYGANDFGSVMMEENVVSKAGASFMLGAADIERHIRYAGFRSARRNIFYERLSDPV